MRRRESELQRVVMQGANENMPGPLPPASLDILEVWLWSSGDDVAQSHLQSQEFLTTS